jgi:sigma-E factor negative regulatory protein RseA
VIQDELESQLSAMFDGELPATECELLARRIDRDENLRARWSRYALIGAAMRSEPVATARSGFARRVSAALTGSDLNPRLRRGRKMMVNAAMSASLVVAVAGLSISLLRTASVGSGASIARADSKAPATPLSTGPGRDAAVVANVATAETAATAATAAIAATADSGAALARRGSNGEPVSYVTPASGVNVNTALRTELADFIVAHSEYSTPLMRRNLLSALVSNEDGTDSTPPGVAVAGVPASPAAGAMHATVAASASGR